MNQVISNTGFKPRVRPKWRAAASPLWKPHRSFDFAQDGELALRDPQGRELVESVEPLCARLKRRGLY